MHREGWWECEICPVFPHRCKEQKRDEGRGGGGRGIPILFSLCYSRRNSSKLAADRLLNILSRSNICVEIKKNGRDNVHCVQCVHVSLYSPQITRKNGFEFRILKTIMLIQNEYLLYISEYRVYCIQLYTVYSLYRIKRIVLQTRVNELYL